MICSLSLASIITFGITLFLYFSHGMQTLNSGVYGALFDIFKFWFPIVWSVSFLFALFRSIKYIFNSCINGYKLKLLTCSNKEYIDVIGYGDLVKVWRKWFMLIIWLSVAQIIFTSIFANLFTIYKHLFDWFNIYWLLGFVLISGYLSFILLSSRCKRVRLKKC